MTPRALIPGAAFVSLLLFTFSLYAQRPGSRRGTPLRVGQVAPDFELELLADSKPATAKAAAKRKPAAENGKVRLSSFRDKKPVVLFFGSYT